MKILFLVMESLPDVLALGLLFWVLANAVHLIFNWESSVTAGHFFLLSNALRRKKEDKKDNGKVSD